MCIVEIEGTFHPSTKKWRNDIYMYLMLQPKLLIFLSKESDQENLNIIYL